MFKADSLTPKTKMIMFSKATEKPDYKCDLKIESGSYLCRNCGIKLFEAKDKFESGTGWPSFDKSYENHVIELLDSDGIRIEITCGKCKSHLGHVFHNELLTKQNTRYCVNSKALDFVSKIEVKNTDEIIVAGGCFWGVEHYMNKLTGILKTEVGYIGGKNDYPTYEDVCYNNTGDYEAVRVVFDSEKINTDEVLKYFFEIHDFTQKNGQGNDIGNQYLSRIFIYNDKQRLIAEEIIKQLKNMNFQVCTQILSMQIFYPAEDYHQGYYQRNGQLPYCHSWKKIF